MKAEVVLLSLSLFFMLLALAGLRVVTVKMKKIPLPEHPGLVTSLYKMLREATKENAGLKEELLKACEAMYRYEKALKAPPVERGKPYGA